MYQNKPLEHGLRMVNLGKDDQVFIREANGNIHCTDCAQATIYLGVSYEGTILLEGKSPKRDGFIGSGTRLGTATDPALWLKDNQSITMSDFYVESSSHYLRMEGEATLPPGRATLTGAKLELANPDNNAVEVTNYRANWRWALINSTSATRSTTLSSEVTRPFAFTLWGSTFYNAQADFKLAVKPGVLGCYGVGSEQAKAQEVPDAALSDAIPHVGNALDDLRRLGAVDLKINYTKEKSAPGDGRGRAAITPTPRASRKVGLPLPA